MSHSVDSQPLHMYMSRRVPDFKGFGAANLSQEAHWKLRKLEQVLDVKKMVNKWGPRKPFGHPGGPAGIPRQKKTYFRDPFLGPFLA